MGNWLEVAFHTFGSYLDRDIVEVIVSAFGIIKEISIAFMVNSPHVTNS